MKIQLDTTAKTIKVDHDVNLGELTEALERLLPNGVWKEFKLEVNATFHWVPNPIIVEPYRPYHPFPWWQQPYWGTGTKYTLGDTVTDLPTTYQLNAGTFNVDYQTQ